MTAIPPNILIVDDIPANVLLLERMLAERGYRPRAVPSGCLALQAANEEAPDLILLDITMPEMNGYEVCERLKAIPHLKDIPVIFISALSETMDKVKAFRVGAVDYVTKPFQFEEVYARVQTHIRLRRLEKLRDDLTHMVVHDLRNPLSVILGFLSILETEDIKKLSPTTRDFITLARLSAEELCTMVNSILDVSKLAASEMKLQLSPCDLQPLVRTLISSMHALLDGRTITFDAPAAPVTLQADPDLLRRILQNLISNAIRYTPAAGDIRITLLPTQDDVRIAITDAGPGIAPENHTRIFEKFGQLGTDNNRTGYGLGLTFCKLAVEAHRGHICVESELGKGSTFWITLPRANPAAGVSAAGIHEPSIRE